MKAIYILNIQRPLSFGTFNEIGKRAMVAITKAKLVDERVEQSLR